MALQKFFELWQLLELAGILLVSQMDDQLMVFLQLNIQHHVQWFLLSPFLIIFIIIQHMQRQRKQKLLKIIHKAVLKKKEARPKQITDERFEKVRYDPRFVKPSKKISKVSVDKRFAKMMKDDRFKVVSQVDRYGRKVQKTDENKELQEFYYLDNQQASQQASENSESQKDQDNEQQYDLQQQQHENLRQWMENYNEQSQTDDNLPIDQIINEVEELWEEEDIIKNQKVQITRRLALCNYDWMNVTAKDLMILFNSFKSQNGVIVSVTIYPSELGKKHMQEQQMHGPKQIWKKNDKIQEVQNANEKKKFKKTLKELFSVQEKDDGIDQYKLRQYQKLRLKYFYAVIQCDNKNTAEQIYNACDGKELENLGSIDLRYIPDQLKFPFEPKQICDTIPAKGECKNNISRAVGHSKVKLTWEDPQQATIAGLKKRNWSKMSDKQLQNIDWSIYLNDELSSQNQNNKHEVIEQDQTKIQQVNRKRKERDIDDDIQITFSGGFDLANKIKQKKQQNQMSTYQKFLKKKKQKRSQKILERKKNKNKLERQEIIQQRDQQKQRRNLELLVDDQKHVDFKPDISDPRFKSIFENNPLFAIEPTSNHFKVNKQNAYFEQVVRQKKNKAK